MALPLRDASARRAAALHRRLRRSGQSSFDSLSWRPVRNGLPYGDPGTNWFIRNAFDEGEYGVGLSAADMDKHDVPTNATFLPALLASEDGTVQTKERAIAIYEREGGLLWKQADFYTGKNETRRARELVLAMIAARLAITNTASTGSFIRMARWK
ncbi:MAG: hypothetical protein U0Y68_12895 [Blastocatellia bacterium]